MRAGWREEKVPRMKCSYKRQYFIREYRFYVSLILSLCISTVYQEYFILCLFLIFPRVQRCG